jgi:Zn-finger nucleic acid-binding protein
MFAGSRFCAKCGAEATRAVVEDAAPLNCPRCSSSLQALALVGVHVRECSACGGLWLDPDALQKLCDAHEEHSAVVSSLESRVPANPAAQDTVRYIPCPQCAKLMNRVNFAHSSGVIMDVCKTHGVWLDRGELQRVMGFIDHGGLAAARQHELAQLDDERRRLEIAKFAGASLIPGYSNVTITTTRSVSPDSSPVGRLLLDALGLFGSK